MPTTSGQHLMRHSPKHTLKDNTSRHHHARHQRYRLQQILQDTPTPVHPHTTTTIINTKPNNRKWNPGYFVYTDGSQIKGNSTVGAGVALPNTLTPTHIDIKSQPERHTINKAELAAMAAALRQENTEDHLSMLTIISFCINAIRSYTIDPTSYNHNLRTDLLQLTDHLLRTRDSKQLRAHTHARSSHTRTSNTMNWPTNRLER